MLTADTITDEQIRAYARDRWRDPWPFGNGRPGSGTIGDAEIIALGRGSVARHIRGRFAELIGTPTCPRCHRPTHASESNDDGICAECLGPEAVWP